MNGLVSTPAATAPTGFWLVFVNNVALNPEHPLPLLAAAAAFVQAGLNHPGQEVGVAPCGPEDLANAGTTQERA
ncbi:hypothetical protein FXF51_01685 [Nonomuraea sp. PA05]|uniref:hypothetical protein n=1 Tax=Nonomuraea sp. PA05 TaxID=2604466 RepID=UPI0011D3037F|nr:hypothetical protein [Nonomuraea sp. PA05]TYB71173.1 hypothetical protein FXF51_01685 [Nonomuraea sp. PA05]